MGMQQQGVVFGNLLSILGLFTLTGMIEDYIIAFAVLAIL